MHHLPRHSTLQTSFPIRFTSIRICCTSHTYNKQTGNAAKQPTNQSTWRTVGKTLSRKRVSLGNLNGRFGVCRLFIATFALWQCTSRLHLSSGYLVLRFNNAPHSHSGRGNGAFASSLNLRLRNFDGLTFKTKKTHIFETKSLT